jgi:hypothetical protein
MQFSRARRLSSERMTTAGTIPYPSGSASICLSGSAIRASKRRSCSSIPGSRRYRPTSSPFRCFRSHSVEPPQSPQAIVMPMSPGMPPG